MNFGTLSIKLVVELLFARIVPQKLFQQLIHEYGGGTQDIIICAQEALQDGGRLHYEFLYKIT
jgi:hypothetical protein